MDKRIKQTLFILLGNALVAFAISTLVLDHQIISGGVTGIGIVVHHYFGISISLVVAIINITLFILGFVFLGKEFALTTLLSTIVFPLFLEFFNSLSWVHHYLDDTLLAAVIAGGMIGIGIGIMMRYHASSGGIDILALIAHDRLKLPVHLVLNSIDFIILALQFPFSDLNRIIYGFVTIMITSYTLNKTITQATKGVQLTIMSDYNDQIREIILKELDAGVTVLYSEKGYTKEKLNTLLTIIPARKLPLIKSKIEAIDPYAFIIIASVDEVGGRGFALAKHA